MDRYTIIWISLLFITCLAVVFVAVVPRFSAKGIVGKESKQKVIIESRKAWATVFAGLAFLASLAVALPQFFATRDINLANYRINKFRENNAVLAIGVRLLNEKGNLSANLAGAMLVREYSIESKKFQNGADLIAAYLHSKFSTRKSNNQTGLTNWCKGQIWNHYHNQIIKQLSIIHVISKNTTKRPKIRLNNLCFHKANINGIDFSSKNRDKTAGTVDSLFSLNGSIFLSSNLDGVKFQGANLANTRFLSNTRLKGAKLQNTYLREADFVGGQKNGAVANLESADLTNAEAATCKKIGEAVRSAQLRAQNNSGNLGIFGVKSLMCYCGPKNRSIKVLVWIKDGCPSSN